MGTDIQLLLQELEQVQQDPMVQWVLLAAEQEMLVQLEVDT
jgi:hypothetical protein